MGVSCSTACADLCADGDDGDESPHHITQVAPAPSHHSNSSSLDASPSHGHHRYKVAHITARHSDASPPYSSTPVRPSTPCDDCAHHPNCPHAQPPSAEPLPTSSPADLPDLPSVSSHTSPVVDIASVAPSLMTSPILDTRSLADGEAAKAVDGEARLMASGPSSGSPPPGLRSLSSASASSPLSTALPLSLPLSPDPPVPRSIAPRAEAVVQLKRASTSEHAASASVQPTLCPHPSHARAQSLSIIQVLRESNVHHSHSPSIHELEGRKSISAVASSKEESSHSGEEEVRAKSKRASIIGESSGFVAVAEEVIFTE